MTTTPAPGQAPSPGRARPLRADAERNRRLILAAAATLYARDGLDAGFDDIASAAGVGVGTVYRRFPTRESLLLALFEDRVEKFVATLEQAQGAPDPVAGLHDVLEAMVTRHVADRGLKEVMFGAPVCAHRMVGVRDRVAPLVEGLLRRGQQTGRLRPDVGVSDLLLGVFMVGAVGALTARTHPEQWRRQLAVFWGGVLVGEASDLPSSPLPPEELTAALRPEPGATARSQPERAAARPARRR